MKKYLTTVVTAFVLLFCFSMTAQAKPYSRGDTNWFIGFGVGSGVVIDKVGNAAGFQGHFKAGLMLHSQFTLGGEFSAFGTQVSDISVYIYSFHLTSQIYLLPNLGLYLKPALGILVGKAQGQFSNVYFCPRIGVGYDFQVGRSLNIGLEMNANIVDHDDDDVQLTLLNMQMVFTFY